MLDIVAKHLPTMTEWARRASPDFNQMYTNSNLSIAPYTSSNGLSYVHGGMSYSNLGSTYSTYSTPYVTNHNQANNMMYLPSSSPMALTYQMQPSSCGSVSAQPRTLAQGPYYRAPLSSNRHNQHPARFPLTHDIALADTEDQESVNQESQCSEPVVPPLEGYPDVDEFDRLMNHYVANLSPKKQDKALIHAKRAANIKAVLIDKKTTSVESAQFRFWVKKMFTLHPNDQTIPARKKKICHDNKPVAIREKLFKILTRAHKQCQHGGRDKTSAQVRRVYSWVPKELISRFVKICPTCQVRRGTNRGSPVDSERSPDAYMDMTSPDDGSPNQSRRTSMATNQTTLHSPLQMSGFSSTFQHQNRWMQPLDASDRLGDRLPKLETSSSAMTGIHENSFDDQAPHQMKPLDSGSHHGYSSMDPHHVMDLSGSAYGTATPQHIPYHTEDMRYGFKMNHYKC